MDQERVLDIQTRNREHFEQAFARRLTVIGFKIDTEGNGIFQLGRWQDRHFCCAWLNQRNYVCGFLLRKAV